MSQAPVRVSPLIKFARWSLLTVGIGYGAFHENRLSKKEAEVRKVERAQKAIRDEKLAAEKKIAAAKEMQALEDLGRPAAKK